MAPRLNAAIGSGASSCRELEEKAHEINSFLGIHGQCFPCRGMSAGGCSRRIASTGSGNPPAC